MSGSELFEGGYTLEDGIAIARELEDGIDLLHVSAGTYQRGFGDTHPSMFKEHGCNVYLAAEIKKHVSIPVATIGGLNDPADAVRQNSPGECVITSGTSDCMRCKKIATAGQVPAFFVSPVVVWGMAGLACAGA